MTTPFHPTPHDQPHPARARAILRAHPEVKELFGRNPWTALIAVGLVAGQTGLAVWFGQLGGAWWPLAVLVAFAIGAFANHCLYVVIHEATHRLVFRGEAANRAVALLADLPNVVPAAMSFRTLYLLHHAHQGDYTHDADLASEWEARLVGHSFAGKLAWLILFPVFQSLRVLRFKNFRLWNGWSVLNALACLGYMTALVYLAGGGAALYLGLSFLFSIGPHPCGARWIQEHYTTDGAQETMSYYGPVNRVALNVGHHNEHHDFPRVPWHRLPRLRALAPEFYGPLRSHDSYVRLLWQFLTDRRYTLFSRVVRTGDATAEAAGGA